MKEFEQVTSVTFNELRNENVVLPTAYLNKFIINAKKYGIDFVDDDIKAKIADKALQDSSVIAKKTAENVSILSKSTSQALMAIEHKDSKKLSKIAMRMRELEAQVDKLREEIYFDDLTKLRNRRWMSEHLVEGSQLSRSGVMVFIDLNDFKEVNDKYGHIFGDKVLSYIAEYIENILKSEFANIGAEVIRYGGDEFIVHIPTLNDALTYKVNRVFSDYQRKLSETKLKTRYDGGEVYFNAGFSIGVGFAGEGENFGKIIDSMDAQMYKNKAQMKQ